MQPEIVDAGGMTLKEARRLLILSRQVRWSFPSSLGRPVRWEPSEPWVESVRKERVSFVKAVAFLMRNGQEDAALEIAANVWRLWVLARDNDGGRRLLAQVLDRGSRKQTRASALALYGDSLLAFRQGRIDESRRRSEEALEVAKSVVDPEALSLANLALSRVAFEDGDYKLALSEPARHVDWRAILILRLGRLRCSWRLNPPECLEITIRRRHSLARA